MSGKNHIIYLQKIENLLNMKLKTSSAKTFAFYKLKIKQRNKLKFNWTEVKNIVPTNY